MAKDKQYYQSYLSMNTISRRGLFRGLLGGTQKSVSTEIVRQVARPPFACPEHLFVSICNGCGDCVSACPYGLIQIRQSKAVLEIDYSACDFCGKCAESCSTNALNHAFKADTELRPVFNQRCLQKNKQPCNTCRQACPQQAILPDLTLDNEKCNGCGECKIACFVNGIELKI
ncbi:ferredoxin-type protein NapF [Glaesserella sp.]|uniref:ferredoxin-type protein NapF n=1 Tax=Glaesserella sp. TaxID=2094731 RepID=UPI00359F7FE2